MNNLNTQISVVIPLYNKEEDILKTIDSILNQTIQPREIIVVNDGSTDQSAHIVSNKKKQDKRYRRVHLINKINGGSSSARNLGIEIASGTHIAFLDADDVWETHFLEEINTMISLYPHAVAYATAYQKINSNGKYIDPKIKKRPNTLDTYLLNNYFEICSHGDLPFITSSICIPKSTLHNVGTFPVGEPIGEDQDLWSRLALHGKIAYSPRVLSFYHLDGTNRICNNNIPTEECGFSTRLHDAIKKGEIPEECQAQVLKYTATHLMHLVKLNVQVGRLDVAEKLLSDTRCHLLNIKRLLLKARVATSSIYPSSTLPPY